ncbi:hypothetical protein ACLKA7_000366 [Drosophila subpalustris]
MTSESKNAPILGQRHLQTLLLFFSIVVNYIAKFNAGVAVVAMTNADGNKYDIPTYDWNEMERSYILSSFFWGYILTQFLGGWLCRRLGAKITMFISTIGSAFLVLLVPFFVPWGGWQAYCGIRVLMGAFQGLLFPCIHAHLANWCPAQERNRLGALANTGIDCGTLLAMFISGLVAASSVGWPGIFYISCGVGILWCIFWLIFGSDSPRECRFITQEELDYIESSINANNSKDITESRQIPVPWKAILTSLPLWALFVARCTQSWGYSTLQAEIPAYLNGVLLMDMKSNALFSALPFLCSWIMAIVYLIASDILLTRGILTITGIRKIVNSLASWLPAIFLIGLSFLDCGQKSLAIVLMSVSVGINAGNAIGSSLNTIDLSPNHAGILMGIVNTGANIVPILTPLLVGIIVKNEEYDWSAAEKSYIISSFFWGYIITQFLGGYLCKLFGVKRVMLWATFSSGVCSAVTPPLIYWGGWGAYCGIRVIMGCAQGVIFPSMHQHLARWSPPEERNRLGALSYTGIECGNVLSMFVSGMIARSPMGWPGISYISAVVAFACCILWIVFGANNVTESRFIGQAEKHYINSSLQHGSNYHKAIIPIPWRAIWTSVPFLALVVTRCAAIYGLSTLQAEIPAYMNGVLQMDIKENALFSALPFVASWALSYVYLIAADILLAKNWLSLTAIRKTMNSFAFWLPAATLIGIGFLDVDQKTLAIVLMTLSVGLNSGGTIGSSINTIDLSANHASILMGIVNTASCVMSVITPLIAGAIVTDKTDRSQWQIVFIITSVIFIVFNCIYVAFGTAKSQPWDAEDYLLGPQPELAKPASITRESDMNKEISS